HRIEGGRSANRPRFAAATNQENPFETVFSQDRRGLVRNFCAIECNNLLRAEDGSRSGRPANRPGSQQQRRQQNPLETVFSKDRRRPCKEFPAQPNVTTCFEPRTARVPGVCCNAREWMQGDVYYGNIGPDMTNINILRASPLNDYLKGNYGVYHCPGDTRQYGNRGLVVRSVSMQCYIGVGWSDASVYYTYFK